MNVALNPPITVVGRSVLHRQSSRVAVSVRAAAVLGRVVGPLEEGKDKAWGVAVTPKSLRRNERVRSDYLVARGGSPGLAPIMRQTGASTTGCHLVIFFHAESFLTHVLAAG